MKQWLNNNTILTLLLFSVLCNVSGQSTAELKKKAQEMGIAPTQAKEIAKQRGMTDAQIQAELKKRGVSADSELGGLTSQEETSADGSTELTEESVVDSPAEDEIEPESEEQAALKPLNRFGYDIFRGDPSVFQSSNFGAVDPNYNIGPGDEVIIMLWGETQFRQVFTVNREGFIFMPEVGQVFVNSQTLGELERKLSRLLSKVYSSISPSTGKATTFMDVSLGNLRPLRIMVLGEVSQPGAYSVSPSATLFTALYYFRGPTALGSLRDIRLIRNGKQIASIDFYDYLLSGKQTNDVRLQLDDVIFIPTRGKTISIQGSINRNAIFELKQDENISDLVQMAGGIEITAFIDRAQIDRVVPFEDRTEDWNDRVLTDFNLGEELAGGKTQIRLHDGDKIQIFSILDMHKNDVHIVGSSVVRPGRYELKPGMRVGDLVEMAEGLLSDVYLPQAHLIRTRPEDLRDELLTINLGKALEGDTLNNIELQWMDRLVVFNENTIENSFKYVRILGSVKSPGTKPFFPGMTLKELFLNAGGFTPEVYRAKVEISRIDPENPQPNDYAKIITLSFNQHDAVSPYFSLDNLQDRGGIFCNYEIQPNDIVSIRRDPYFNPQRQVTIAGSVVYPGTYSIDSPTEKITDIVSRAGGLRPEAYPMGSTFQRNGVDIQISMKEILRRPSSSMNFTLKHGDIIAIPEHPELVYVNGEVNSPGAYKYIPGKNLRYYLKNAGGYAPDADVDNVYASSPDGTSILHSKWSLFSPGIPDGSIITVSRVEDAEPFDKTEFAKEMTAIFANFAQVVSVIYLATR